MARSNLKQTWKVLNEVINRRIAKAPYPASFSKNGLKISNPVDIANNFCDYFTNIGSNLKIKSRHKFFVSLLNPFRCKQRSTN